MHRLLFFQEFRTVLADRSCSRHSKRVKKRKRAYLIPNISIDEFLRRLLFDLTTSLSFVMNVIVYTRLLASHIHVSYFIQKSD